MGLLQFLVYSAAAIVCVQRRVYRWAFLLTAFLAISAMQSGLALFGDVWQHSYWAAWQSREAVIVVFAVLAATELIYRAERESATRMPAILGTIGGLAAGVAVASAAWRLWPAESDLITFLRVRSNVWLGVSIAMLIGRAHRKVFDVDLSPSLALVTGAVTALFVAHAIVAPLGATATSWFRWQWAYRAVVVVCCGAIAMWVDEPTVNPLPQPSRDPQPSATTSAA